MRLSFLGTGLMGAPMAERLHNSGFDIIAYNRTVSKLHDLKNKGIKTTSYAHQAVEQSEIIVLMLTDYEAIQDVIIEKVDKDILQNKTVIQMGTIRPLESRELEEFLKPLHCVYLEAPVLGSIKEVKSGNLIVMCGGEKSVFDEHKKMLHIFGETLIYTGITGKAAALKLALNQLIATLTCAFSISLSYIKKNEISTDIFMDILRKSALYAPTFDKKFTNMMTNDFSKTNFPAKHLLKDLNLIYSETMLNNIHSGIPKAVIDIIKITLEKGYSEQDYSSIYTAIAGE